jgi:hypothetical protein
MQPIVIALVGAGSRSFGPETVRDMLLSEALAQRRVELRLMDIVADNLLEIGHYACRPVAPGYRRIPRPPGRGVFTNTTDTEPRHDGAGAQDSYPGQVNVVD